MTAIQQLQQCCSVLQVRKEKTKKNGKLLLFHSRLVSRCTSPPAPPPSVVVLYFETWQKLLALCRRVRWFTFWGNGRGKRQRDEKGRCNMGAQLMRTCLAAAPRTLKKSICLFCCLKDIQLCLLRIPDYRAEKIFAAAGTTEFSSFRNLL